MVDSAPPSTASTTAPETGSLKKRRLSVSPAAGPSLASPSKRVKEEATAGASAASKAKKPKAAAKPELTTVWVVKRSSAPLGEDLNSGDDDESERGFETWTVGIYAHQAAAEKACRAEYRDMGIDRRMIRGSTNNWQFEGAADLLDPDTAMDVCEHSGWVLSQKYDRQIHKLKDVDWSEGEDYETDVEQAQKFDDEDLRQEIADDGW